MKKYHVSITHTDKQGVETNSFAVVEAVSAHQAARQEIGKLLKEGCTSVRCVATEWKKNGVL